MSLTYYCRRMEVQKNANSNLPSFSRNKVFNFLLLVHQSANFSQNVTHVKSHLYQLGTFRKCMFVSNLDHFKSHAWNGTQNIALKWPARRCWHKFIFRNYCGWCSVISTLISRELKRFSVISNLQAYYFWHVCCSKFFGCCMIWEINFKYNMQSIIMMKLIIVKGINIALLWKLLWYL